MTSHKACEAAMVTDQCVLVKNKSEDVQWMSNVFSHFRPKHRDTLLICINILKPTGHVMHQQFNIQQLYALPTLYLCVLYLSENEQQLMPLTA